jgi:alcohol dehydrogenase class IV
VNAEQQESVKKIFWESMSEEEWFKRGFKNETTDAGDLVRSFVQKLGLPTRLSEVGVTDEGTIGKVAESTLKDVWGKTNPRPLQTKDDVLEILRMAA